MSSPGVAPLQPGDLRAVGPFRLVGVLGAGGMGRVLLGVAPDGERVAVKLVHAALADDDRFRARFRREIEIGRRVPDRWAASVLAADLDAATPWLATRYIHGPTLHQVIAALGPLPPETVTTLAAGLARGLADLHGLGLIHRDLKPSNTILAADGPRLIDFGIATAIDATRMTSTGVAIGSPAYMSPEQARGEEAGPPSDVFAFGALLVMASTGRSPFGGGPALAVIRRVLAGRPDLGSTPEPLRGVVQACLHPEAARRPAATALVGRLGPPPAAGWLPSGVVALTPPVPEEATVSATLLDPAPSDAGRVAPTPRRLRISRRAVLTGLGAAAVTAGGLWWFTGPGVRWTLPVPQEVASACAADGVVVLGLKDSSLQALDVATGRLLWSYAAAGDTRKVLATRGTVVAGNFGVDLHAGTSRWKLGYEQPLAASTMLGFVGSAGTTTAVQAWAPDTGATTWSYRIPESVDSRHTVRDVAIVGDIVHAVVEGIAVSIDTASVSRRWAFSIPPRNQSTPQVVASSSTVYVADGSVVYALDAATGALRWQHDGMVNLFGATLAADDTALYGVVKGTSFLDDRMSALDAYTGATRWTWAPATPINSTSPVVVGDTVFVIGPSSRSLLGSGSSDAVHALSIGSGSHRWSKDIPGSETGRPVAMQALPDGLLVATTRSLTVFSV